MTQKQKQYSKQFKVDAVKLVTEQGYKVSEAARNLGIHNSSLRRWKKLMISPWLSPKLRRSYLKND